MLIDPYNFCFLQVMRWYVFLFLVGTQSLLDFVCNYVSYFFIYLKEYLTNGMLDSNV